MNILVVGGAGYIGGYATDQLLKAGHQVKVYDGLLYEDVYLKPVDFIGGDIRDQAKLTPLLQWAEAVVWLAALVGDGACALDPPLTKKINTDAVQWLAQTFYGRIVFLSTCSVYGAQDGLLDEHSPPNPLSVYAQTKVDAERELLCSAADVTIFRLGTLFGIGDAYSRLRLDLVVNSMTVRACRGQDITVYGGQQWRPLLHVRDVGYAIAQVIERSTPKPIYNLGYKNFQIVEVAEAVREAVPYVEIHHIPGKFEDLRNYRVDWSAAVKDWGFKPRLDLQHGIYQMTDIMDYGRLARPDHTKFVNAHHLQQKGWPTHV